MSYRTPQLATKYHTSAIPPAARPVPRVGVGLHSDGLTAACMHITSASTEIFNTPEIAPSYNLNPAHISHAGFMKFDDNTQRWPINWNETMHSTNAAVTDHIRKLRLNDTPKDLFDGNLPQLRGAAPTTPDALHLATKNKLDSIILEARRMKFAFTRDGARYWRDILVELYVASPIGWGSVSNPAFQTTCRSGIYIAIHRNTDMIKSKS